MNGDNDVIYLDHAATTPVHQAVLAAMMPYFSERYGNPSSIYQLGQEGRAALDRARATVARVLGCQTAEITFTSGATESDNLALNGVAWHRRLTDPRGPAPHIVTTAIEHHAVLHTADWLERQGFAVTRVPVDEQGFVDPLDVERSLRPETCLVSVMYANNEIGSIQPLPEIGRIAREHGVPLHTDAVQAPGSLPLNVDALGVDLLSLSAHKFYGPKGVGLLYVRRGVGIAYQQHGGGQESGRRGGTENVPGIVGLAVALEQAEASRAAYHRHCTALRDRLAQGLLATIPQVEINGPTDWSRRLPNNLNLAIRGVQGETALLSLDMQGIAASAGSACTTGNAQPSHVLQALGLSDERCRSSLRLTLGWSNTEEQIDDTIAVLGETVAHIRELASAGVA
jgi:cysteine desulfurase